MSHQDGPTLLWHFRLLMGALIGLGAIIASLAGTMPALRLAIAALCAVGLVIVRTDFRLVLLAGVGAVGGGGVATLGGFGVRDSLLLVGLSLLATSAVCASFTPASQRSALSRTIPGIFHLSRGRGDRPIDSSDRLVPLAADKTVKRIPCSISDVLLATAIGALLLTACAVVAHPQSTGSLSTLALVLLLSGTLTWTVQAFKGDKGSE